MLLLSRVTTPRYGVVTLTNVKKKINVSSLLPWSFAEVFLKI